MENQSRLNQKRILLFAVIATSIAVAVALFAHYRARPDKGVMYRYALSKLSDDEIRMLAARAHSDWIQRRNANVAAAARSDEQRARSFERCQDAAYRLRHENECSPRTPLFTEGLPEPTESDLLYQAILGPCLIASTIWEARTWGCL